MRISHSVQDMLSGESSGDFADFAKYGSTISWVSFLMSSQQHRVTPMPWIPTSPGHDLYHDVTTTIYPDPDNITISNTEQLVNETVGIFDNSLPQSNDISNDTVSDNNTFLSNKQIQFNDIRMNAGVNDTLDNNVVNATLFNNVAIDSLVISKVIDSLNNNSQVNDTVTSNEHEENNATSNVMTTSIADDEEHKNKTEAYSRLDNATINKNTKNSTNETDLSTHTGQIGTNHHDSESTSVDVDNIHTVQVEVATPKRTLVYKEAEATKGPVLKVLESTTMRMLEQKAIKPELKQAGNVLLNHYMTNCTKSNGSSIYFTKLKYYYLENRISVVQM
jgi:hypothetical protein